MSRVSRKKSNRPLLSRRTTVADIAEMLSAREEYYACADFRINTSTQELNKVVNEIVAQVKKLGVRRQNLPETQG